MVDRVGKPRARAPDAARVAVETLDRDRRCPADFFCRGPPPPVAAVAAFFGGGDGAKPARGGGRVSTRSRHAPIASSFRCSARPRSPFLVSGASRDATCEASRAVNQTSKKRSGRPVQKSARSAGSEKNGT